LPGKVISVRRPGMTDFGHIASKGYFVVVLHDFHADVLEEMLEALGGLECRFALFFTMLLARSHAALARIQAAYRRSEIDVQVRAGAHV